MNLQEKINILRDKLPLYFGHKEVLKIKRTKENAKLLVECEYEQYMKITHLKTTDEYIHFELIKINNKYFEVKRYKRGFENILNKDMIFLYWCEFVKLFPNSKIKFVEFQKNVL